MKRLNKLILSLVMAFGAFATLVSTTYAFVILQNETKVEEFDFDIESDVGLLISLDGVNFNQDITLDKLKTQIETNTGKKYEEVKYQGVTLKNSGSRVAFDENSGKPLFIKDSLNSSGKHVMNPALKNDYLMLDIYLRVANQGDRKDNLSLRLKNTSISSKVSAQKVKVQNTFSYKDLLTDKLIELSPDGKNNMITVNPVDAMRLAVQNTGVAPSSEEAFQVFEPTIGLASSAIEGAKDPIHMKEYNPMYQYYNSVHEITRLEQGAPNHDGFKTKSEINGTEVGMFTYDVNKRAYNDIHLVVLLFLEGWDADFFLGIPVEAQSFSVKLGFEIIK